MQQECLDYLIDDSCLYLKFQKQKHKILVILRLQVTSQTKKEKRNTNNFMTHKWTHIFHNFQNEL